MVREAAALEVEAMAEVEALQVGAEVVAAMEEKPTRST